MIPTPHFPSHSEQVKALGCAADFDPDKHPRRAAQLIARQRFEKGLSRQTGDSTKARQDAARAERAALAERAKWYADLTMSEAAKQLGISYSTVQKLKHEFGLSFADSVPTNREAEIVTAAETHGSYRAVAEALGLSRSYVLRVLHKHGIYLRGNSG